MRTLDLQTLVPTPAVDGERIHLRPLTAEFLEPYAAMLADPDGRRFTGTHRTFGRDEVVAWLSSRQDAPGRADWAIVTADDGEFLGEVVLMDIDGDNLSGSFRIALAGPEHYGRGYGTEATRLVVAFAFDVVGLHRLSLEVYDFNDRARAVYERCGFVEEGRLRDALQWEGEWHDAIVMSVLAPERPA